MVPSIQNMKTCGVIPKQSTQLSSRGRQSGLQLEHTSKLQTSTRLRCDGLSCTDVTHACPLHPRLLALPPQSSHFPNNLYPRCHFTLHPSEILRQEHQPKLHPRHERLRTRGGFSPSYSCAWWTQDSGHLFHAPLASFSFPKSHDFLALLLRITTSGSMQTWNF